MASNNLSADKVIAKLIEMGFENSCAVQAVKKVGPSLDNAVECIVNDSAGDSRIAPTNSECSTTSRKRTSSSTISGQMKQSSILDHFQSTNRPKKSRTNNVVPDISISKSEILTLPVDEAKVSLTSLDSGNIKTVPEGSPIFCQEEFDIELDWEQKANFLLKKHFGYPSLKSFQKEALAAWIANQDCLVLAATGSGKSLCFQIPALLTGKVVVVISPLISLMHDQCLKLSRHGISACFLGSGQPDSTVEQKAMGEMEFQVSLLNKHTIFFRLIKQLQRLAESRGIALFAIDEVHCVSKWGHDFRPDYRRLSVLRENFSACNLHFLKFDIPLMALTATATIQVREDILKSLSMSKETKIVLTSFFRPNLRFLVKHSRTSSSSSYKKDFRQLVDIYARKKKKKQSVFSEVLNDFSDSSDDNNMSDTDECSDLDDEVTLVEENGSTASEGKELSVEYLENDIDIFQSANDWDVACGEFSGKSPHKDIGSTETADAPSTVEERLKLMKRPIEEGPTIIYVPTRKETLSIANHLCDFGVKAAPYNASLSKAHLRRVHKEFQDNMLEVVVATIAFGMGIDKLNVRRIIHYGWPQSLEAYYQEAGRAGRDGKLAECILYANLSRLPSLLPSKRSENQMKQAYKMLSDCFRYGMNTSCCRAKTLVEYFGEDFSYEKCLLCDVCILGPSEMQNLQEEANILMQIIAAHHSSFLGDSYDDTYGDSKSHRLILKPNLRMFVSKLREQSQKFWAKDQLWWRGLARVLEDKGYIRESNDKIHVQINFPEPTKLGLEFLDFGRNEPFNIYPEADMLLSMNEHKSHSTFADWGKGWADPEIRRQRLERRRSSTSRKQQKPRQPRKRKSRKVKPDMRTSRGRITAKLSKLK
ncbi:ATP-dependent DNA helicase Q-like SIM isoform X3 [Jatropha curcas]|uniref:ATP-dependent DNA helicase Q-like SIM isoform X3 n=1 Tax=Jatropha curcas TaxID=180498 RepID=UPI001893ADEB|nr:ATP-dependent DNA helicase Q-like SIM isoform X3 [Jatropha curcas]